MKGTVTIHMKHLAIAAYVLLMLPICLFFLGWLKPYWGISATALMVAGFVWIYRKDFSGDAESVTVPLLHLIGVFILFGLVVAISGVAGIGVSGFDIPWRNAIFHDLINFNWPVIYDNGNALVYYCTFWLPAALVGKVLGWTGGLFALWLFVVLIMAVSYLLILCWLQIQSPARMWMAAIFLVCWSGLQFLGAAIISMSGYSLYNYGLLTDGSGYMDFMFNGESFNWYYRSNFMTLQMTYNQLLIWLAVPLAMVKRKARDYLFLGLLVLPYSPWGFIGLIPLLIVLAWPDLEECGRSGGAKAVLKNLLSPANLSGLITIGVVFAFYYLASAKTGGSSGSTYLSPDQVDAAVAAGIPYTTQTGSFGFLSWDRFSIRTVAALVFFWVMEFGVFMFLIAPKYRKKPLFWCVLIVLMIVPLMWAGTISGRDFCMNASLPALFVLMILTLKYMNEEVCGKSLGVRSLCLILALTIAFIGPAYSMLGRMKTMRSAGSIAVIDDSIGTLSDKSINEYSNFLIDNPSEKLFYSYLAR